MKCTNCGKELEENVLRCDVCGTENCETGQEGVSEGSADMQIGSVTESATDLSGDLPTSQPEDSVSSLPESEEDGDQEEAAPVIEDDIEQEVKKTDVKMLLKKYWALGAFAAAVIICISMAAVNSRLKGEMAESAKKKALEYDEVAGKYVQEKKAKEKLQTDYEVLLADYELLQADYDELENGAAAQLVEITNAYENGEWAEVIKLSGLLHESYNGTEEDTKAQELAAQSQANIDAANAEAAAKEAQGYETGISYDQLSRTPEDFNGEKVKFSGKVIQVMEGTGSVTIRFAVDGSYDHIILGSYSSSIVSTRILEDDYITIYGTSKGTTTYETVMGNSITIPSVSIEKIDQ